MNTDKPTYLLNSFSLQMIVPPATVTVIEVNELPDGLTSAIGHADTAQLLNVQCNRVEVHLDKGDVAYVAQLISGRLPEGTTQLPDNARFRYLKVKIE